MQMQPILTFALVSLLLSFVGQAQQQPARLDGPLPYAAILSRQGDKIYVVRIVDGRSGQPLPGAKLHAIVESRQPHPSSFVPTRSATADALGFARMTNPPQTAWFFAAAEGYGTTAWLGARGLDDNVARLLPGVDVPVQLLDAMGRPVPDAEIGFALGCGHTPNVRSARTGADGVAPLTGINPTRSFGNNTIRDLYPVSPVVDGNYVSLTWLPGDGPYRLQKPPGTMSSGRVVDANGKPLAGAWVGEPDMHRGPWTKTDIEGEFVLLGRRGFSRFLLVEELAGRPLLDFEAPPKTPLTVRVVPEGTAPRPQGQLTVRLRLDNGHAFGHCTLRATALVHSDDYEGLLEFDAAGTAIANLPIGDVVIWGQPTPDCEPIERIVPVTAAGNELAIAVAKRPTIRVPLVNMPEDVAISVVTMDEPARDVTEDLRNGHAFAVPAAEPFAFVMRRNRTERFMRRDRTAHFIYCESAAQARGQQLSWPAPMRINTRIVDAAGKPVAANVQCNRMMVPMSKTKRGWQTCQSDGTVSFTTHGQGAMMLHVQPVDPALKIDQHAVHVDQHDGCCHPHRRPA